MRSSRGAVIIGVVLLCSFFFLRHVPAAGISRELPTKIAALFQDPRFEGFTVSAQVVALGSGSVLFEKNPKQPLIPASSVKLVTAATALKKLGPEFVFRTEALKNGAEVWIRGGGDPSLVTERLYLLASDIRASGIQKISRLCADESRAPPPLLQEARKPEETDRAFNAPIGALNLNYNSVRVHFSPEKGKLRARVEPPGQFVQVVTSGVKLVSGPKWQLVFTRKIGPKNDQIVVSGSAPRDGSEKIRYFNVSRPGPYLLSTLGKMLEKEGIRVKSLSSCVGVTPQGAVPLASVDSFPLREIVVLMDKFSNNFISEALVNELGHQAVGNAGSRAEGLSVLETSMRNLGLWQEQTRIVSPSGLDRATRMSAASFVGLIRDLATDSSVLPEFLSSLPLAGRDGTLKDRIFGFNPIGSLRAKTGTLDGVGSLVGIVQAVTGRLYVFAVILNYKDIERIDTRFWESPLAQLLIDEG